MVQREKSEEVEAARRGRSETDSRILTREAGWELQDAAVCSVPVRSSMDIFHHSHWTEGGDDSGSDSAAQCPRWSRV